MNIEIHIIKMSKQQNNEDNNELIDLTNYDEKYHDDIQKYISSLNSVEICALVIARDHLESSFNIVKSIGFQKSKKNL